ncbi:MurR/RpiR family transcriptional regulator [Salibacterium aidingense]|uniref:MurR/RpiR family transcriptional regulator n=1 Tax=Salibacterium aidingense TaxID=384933 RepID=UPI00040835F7|nr:MurR/RpiR family transcriptional regulator [Salibacterium aidingense]
MEKQDYSASLKGGLTLLKEMMNRLPKSEKKIAAFIVDYPRDSVQCTAQELGERSGTSSAAVMRLCKSLGLQGLPDLKLRINGDLQMERTKGYREIEPGESYEQVVQKMLANSQQAMMETTDTMNYQQLKRAIHFIRTSSRLYFFGVGASNLIAQDAEQKFIRINRNVTAFTDAHMAATQLAGAGGDDLFFAISFSGETKEVTRVMELAKQQGVRTVSLTRLGQSTLSASADCTLFTSASMEPTVRSGATSSRLAQLYMIDILFMCVVTESYEDSIHYIEQTRKAINFLQQE